MNSATRLPAVVATVPVALPGDADFAHPDCPVERRVRSHVHPFQFSFAIEAAQRLDGRFADVVFEPSRKGLQLLARNELALQSPTAALAALYPGKLDLGMAQVRYCVDDPVREPVMTVLVRVPYAVYASVRLDLTEREARCVETELGPRAAIVRAEVRQAQLLGYPEWLGRTTEGMASVCIGLSHYTPVAPSPAPWLLEREGERDELETRVDDRSRARLDRAVRRPRLVHALEHCARVSTQHRCVRGRLAARGPRVYLQSTHPMPLRSPSTAGAARRCR